MSKYAIEVDNVKIRFNLSNEKVDNLKDTRSSWFAMS